MRQGAGRGSRSAHAVATGPFVPLQKGAMGDHKARDRFHEAKTTGFDDDSNENSAASAP